MRISWASAGVLLFFLLPPLTAFVLPRLSNVKGLGVLGGTVVCVILIAAGIGSMGKKREKTSSLLERQHKNASIQLWIGCLMPVLFLGAMFFYNGDYCWYSDFISESGLVFVGGGTPNHLAACFLTAGLTGSGILCGWYFGERFRWGGGYLWQRVLILIFGVIGALGLVGIGVAPFDQHPHLHNFFTLCSVPLGVAILLASATGTDVFGRWTEKVIWLVFLLFMILVIGCLGYLRRLGTGGFPSNPTGPIIQKIVVLGFYVFMLGQVIAYWGRTRKGE